MQQKKCITLRLSPCVEGLGGGGVLDFARGTKRQSALDLLFLESESDLINVERDIQRRYVTRI